MAGNNNNNDTISPSLSSARNSVPASSGNSQILATDIKTVINPKTQIISIQLDEGNYLLWKF